MISLVELVVQYDFIRDFDRKMFDGQASTDIVTNQASAECWSMRFRYARKPTKWISRSKVWRFVCVLTRHLQNHKWIFSWKNLQKLHEIALFASFVVQTYCTRRSIHFKVRCMQMNLFVLWHRGFSHLHNALLMHVTFNIPHVHRAIYSLAHSRLKFHFRFLNIWSES